MKFWSKVLIGDGCWNWVGSICRDGYGKINLAGLYLAHRFSFSDWYQKEIGKLCVLHKCDNPSCVRPDHLFLGTQEENILDMEKKGRAYHPIGDDHGRAKLTEIQVVEIRKLRASGISTGKLSKMFLVSKTNILSIVARSSWKHI